MLRRFFRGRRETVEIDDAGVKRVLGNGQVEAVTWDALTEVSIVTTAGGPFEEDVFFLLRAGDAGCAVPQSQATGDFVSRLQALPGFDNQAMIDAMGTATDARFVCWTRD